MRLPYSMYIQSILAEECAAILKHSVIIKQYVGQLWEVQENQHEEETKKNHCALTSAYFI